MFRGSSTIRLDGKGRLTVPTRHRDSLAAESGGDLVVTAFPLGCLILCGREVYETLERDALGKSALHPEGSMWQEILVGHAEYLQMDSAGRVALTKPQREYANLRRNALLLGVGRHFRIWDEEKWNQKRQAKSDADGGIALPDGWDDIVIS